MKKYAIVLAAGKGTRMRTEMPKCAYPILKKPMIEYIVENIEKSVIDETVVVVGHKREVLQDILKDRVMYAVQEEQLGTGHAVMSAKELLKDKEGMTFILPGDMPLIHHTLIDKIFAAHIEMGNNLTVVSMMMDYPKSYGRIVRDEYNSIQRIVEENDCDEYQKQIKEVNTSIYIVDNKTLFEVLEKIPMNAKKGEYYLTDIVELMHKEYKINSFIVRDSRVTMGVNDLYGISIAEKVLRDYINKNHMLSGVSIINPETVTIGHNVIIEEGVIIHPNTTITGNSIIKSGATIGPNTEIHNSTVGFQTVVNHSLVYDSTIGNHTTVGPFAHLRGHAEIGNNNRIGNFVEVKGSKTGDETKAAHLSYIGDAVVGSNVNFGCGSITVNYDGKYKHKTVIGNDVFIGCNVNLIAPINIGDQVFLAAGSTVTDDVPTGAFTIARNRQINKSDYAKNLIKPHVDKTPGV